MQFSDSTNKLGIVEQIDFLCDTDSTSYPSAQKTREINVAYEKLIGKLISANNDWRFDDTNYSDFPIGYTTLVAGQEDYTLDTSFLTILRVEVMDSGGIWHLLNEIDLDSLDMPREEYQKTSGLPYEYDLDGKSVILKPGPSATQVTLANGMRIYFQRTASLFAASDTTKVPGFASPYHPILSYRAAIPYCVKYKPQRVQAYMLAAAELENDLMAFETNKDKGHRKALQMRGISHR